ncbi:MAG TPA: hypothetical protein VMT11_11360 [Myxococcaceae bacterium]|nr:hypothetical protein [Myxococcaceae bacterium]
MNHRLSLRGAVAALALLWTPASRAGGLEISGAAAYWTESSSAFSVTLGKFWDLAGFQLGPRVGFGYVTSPSSAGVPADLVARLGIGTFYLEGQAGAWLLFVREPVVRFHATGGGGLDLGIVRIGVEGGYLHDGGLFGARVSVAL